MAHFSRPVCILGMHRSGTSMVTRLLQDCGLYLGPDEELLPPSAEDNRDGYWENRRFVDLNERMLAVFGGSWDAPPLMPEGWTTDPRLEPLRVEARDLIRDLSAHPFWGWKDPRTCLTLPFWMELLPDLKIVLCVRHPVEVTQSLSVRVNGYVPRDRAMQLWHDHYDQVLSTCGPTPVTVTHYVSYFYDAGAELSRVLLALDNAVETDTIASASASVDRTLWRGVRVADSELERHAPYSVRALYEQLRLMGGPILLSLRQDRDFQEELNRIALSNSLERIERLEELNRQRVEEIERLRGMLSHVLHIKRLFGRGVSLQDRLEEARVIWAGLLRRVAH